MANGPEVYQQVIAGDENGGKPVHTAFSGAEKGKALAELLRDLAENDQLQNEAIRRLVTLYQTRGPDLAAADFADESKIEKRLQALTVEQVVEAEEHLTNLSIREKNLVAALAELGIRGVDLMAQVRTPGGRRTRVTMENVREQIAHQQAQQAAAAPKEAGNILKRLITGLFSQKQQAASVPLRYPGGQMVEEEDQTPSNVFFA